MSLIDRHAYMPLPLPLTRLQSSIPSLMACVACLSPDSMQMRRNTIASAGLDCRLSLVLVTGTKWMSTRISHACRPHSRWPRQVVCAWLVWLWLCLCFVWFVWFTPSCSPCVSIVPRLHFTTSPPGLSLSLALASLQQTPLPRGRLVRVERRPSPKLGTDPLKRIGRSFHATRLPFSGHPLV